MHGDSDMLLRGAHGQHHSHAHHHVRLTHNGEFGLRASLSLNEPFCRPKRLSGTKKVQSWDSKLRCTMLVLATKREKE